MTSSSRITRPYTDWAKARAGLRRETAALGHRLSPFRFLSADLESAARPGHPLILSISYCERCNRPAVKDAAASELFIDAYLLAPCPGPAKSR